MGYRGLLAIIVAASAFAGASCTAPDPGDISYAERKAGGSSGDTSSSSTSSGGGSSTSSSGGAVDAGTDGGAADPVFGTSTFAYVNPGQNANNANAAHGGTVQGKNCIQAGCHLGGGQPWAFGGTVFTAATGGTPVAQAEVRVTGPTGTEYGRAYTDANGNFWVSVAGAIPANAKVGVRDGTKKKIMATTIAGAAGASCYATTCHAAAAPGQVFLN
jgi:hypothetical protein